MEFAHFTFFLFVFMSLMSLHRLLLNRFCDLLATILYECVAIYIAFYRLTCINLFSRSRFAATVTATRSIWDDDLNFKNSLCVWHNEIDSLHWVSVVSLMWAACLIRAAWHCLNWLHSRLIATVCFSSSSNYDLHLASVCLYARACVYVCFEPNWPS